MAHLCYILNGKQRTLLLPSHAHTPGRTVLAIGSNPRHINGQLILTLPAEKGITPDHAMVIETKRAHFYVLVDRGAGSTLVNGAPVLRLKVLRHLDCITLGDTGHGEPIELIFGELVIKKLQNDFTCKVCWRTSQKGDLVFECPNDDRCYCFQCAVADGITCACGYDFGVVTRRILQTADIGLHFKTQDHHLRIKTVEADSPLLERKCTLELKTRVEQQPHIMRSFQVGDQVVSCPECGLPYHLKCWLTLQGCINPHCTRTRIDNDVLSKLFGLD